VFQGVVRVEHLSAPEDHVKEVLERAKKEYITRTYNLGDWSKDDHVDFLEKLAVKSGKLLKGGEPDISTVSQSWTIALHTFSGRIGTFLAWLYFTFLPYIISLDSYSDSCLTC
jgi:ribosome biogenesis GTPase A